MIKRGRKAFTLVELVVVIAVIAILSGVSIAVYSGITKNAKQTALFQEAYNAGTVAMLEEDDHKLDDGSFVLIAKDNGYYKFDYKDNVLNQSSIFISRDEFIGPQDNFFTYTNKENKRKTRHSVANVCISELKDNAIVYSYGNVPSKTQFPTPEEILKGKKLSILGDSISTFKDSHHSPSYNPEGNATYYYQDDTKKTPNDINDTYWMKLINKYEFTLGVNESYSGSYISKTSDNVPAMCSTSRVESLGSNGNPDLVFLYGGTNDFQAQSGYTEGTFDINKIYLNETGDSFNDFSTGFAVTIERIQNAYPKAEIVVLLNNSGKSIAIRNQGDDVMKSICNSYIESRGFNINIVDLRESFFLEVGNEYTLNNMHPNAAGHNKIYEFVSEKLSEYILSGNLSFD